MCVSLCIIPTAANIGFYTFRCLAEIEGNFLQGF